MMSTVSASFLAAFAPSAPSRRSITSPSPSPSPATKRWADEEDSLPANIPADFLDRQPPNPAPKRQMVESNPLRSSASQLVAGLAEMSLAPKDAKMADAKALRRDKIYEAWFSIKAPTLGQVYDLVSRDGVFSIEEIRDVIQTLPVHPGTPAPVFIGLDDGNYLRNIQHYIEGLVDYVYVNPTTLYYREFLEGWPMGRHTVVVASTLHHGVDRVFGWTGMSLIVSGARVMAALGEFVEDRTSGAK